MNSVKILSVICDDVEYRCEQTEVPTSDCRGEPYTEVMRSKWLSSTGAELEDRIAMMLYREQSENTLEETNKLKEAHEIKYKK